MKGTSGEDAPPRGRAPVERAKVDFPGTMAVLREHLHGTFKTLKQRPGKHTPPAFCLPTDPAERLRLSTFARSKNSTFESSTTMPLDTLDSRRPAS